MSTTKKFGLGKLALQSNNAQSALSSMRNFYQNNATVGVGNLAMQQQQLLQQRQQHLDQEKGSMHPLFNRWPEELSSPHKVGRLSKVIGVKKTLINQMQGMVQPKLKSHPMGLAQTSSKYKIYGQTKLFSSMSCLQSRSSCNNNNSSSSANLPPVSQKRCFSSVRPTVALNSLVQHRYNQFGETQEKRNEELAKDISRSIQSELMAVDFTTKKLVSYARDKLDPSNFEEQEQQKQQQKQQLQMQQHHPFRLDSLGGWNYPRLVKPTESVSKEDNLKKQQKPLRRKLTNIRYKEDFSVPIQQQFSKHSLPNRNLQAQLGELYAKTTKMHSKKQRSDLREQQKHSELGVFDERSKQTTSERDYIERNLLKTERKELAALPIDAHGRMDDVHYQSKIAANLLSASQLVINKQFADYSKNMVDAPNKSKQGKLANNIIQSPSPTPMVNLSSKGRAAKPRFLSLGRASFAKPIPSTDSPKSAAAVTQPKRFVSEIMPQKNSKLDHSVSSSSISKITASNKFENTMRSNSTNASWNKGSFKQVQHGHQGLYGDQRVNVRQALQSPHAWQMQIGEMRDYQKSMENETVDSLKDDVLMPPVYTKESAVQRLGNLIDKHASHAYLRRKLKST